jgi:hypothetical protein
MVQGIDLAGEKVDCAALIERAQNLMVTNPEQEAAGIELGKELREALKKLKTRYEELVGGAQSWVSQVQAWVRGPRREIEGAIALSDSHLVEYRKKVMEAQRKAEREAAEKTAKAEKKAEKTGKVFVPPPPPVPLAKTTSTETAAGTYRMVKRWKVKDEKKIPRDLWMLDEKKINGMVRAGVQAIDGIEIYEEPDLAIR